MSLVCIWVYLKTSFLTDNVFHIPPLPTSAKHKVFSCFLFSSMFPIFVPFVAKLYKLLPSAVKPCGDGLVLNIFFALRGGWFIGKVGGGS